MQKLQKITLTLFFLLVFSNLIADDSLQSLYKQNFKAIKTTDTTLIIKSYKYLGDYLCVLGDYKNSNLYLTKGLEMAIKANEIKQIGIIHNLLATNDSYTGNRQLALNHYHQALKAFADIKNLDKVAMILMNMGSEYEFAGNLNYAIAYKLKALKNKQASGNQDDLAYYFQNVGQLFKETNVEKWKYYVVKAYEISKKSEGERISTRAAILNDLAGIAKIEKNYKQAYAWYDSMYVLCKEAEYDNGLATVLSNRCLLYRADKKPDKALNDILQAIDISSKLNRNYSVIVNHTYAANILIDMNRVAEAKFHANKALLLAKSLKSYPEEEAMAHLALATIGEKTKNWELAYTHYNAYKEGIDTIRDAEVQKSMHDVEVKYQTSEKEKEIARLDNENKLKSLRLQRIQIQIIAIVVIALLLGILVLLQNRKKKLNYQKQQAELKQKLLRSQMNPHFMFNTLNAINQYIQTNKGHEASDYLAQYSKLMRQILENSAVEFVSLETEIEFLHNYLAMQQLRFDKSFEYVITLDDNIDPEAFEIPPMIAQPFIENAIEHGVRGVVDGIIKIEFCFKKHVLTLRIADNGKGFQSTSNDIKHRSFAIDITRERLNISGNNSEKLVIKSPDPQTGKGTLVSIDMPFKKD
jgi:hypothetical protein